MKKLFIRLNSVHPLPAKLLERLEKKVQKKVFNSGDFILRTGQICRYVYYIERGIVSHKSTGDKAEATTWILCENDIVTSVISFFKQIPSVESIIALGNTIVWCIPYTDWEQAYLEFEDFKILTDKVKTEYYGRKEAHTQLILTHSSKQIIQYVLGKNPEFLDRVDRETLSSYCGMSSKTFNKYL
jgi:signal-transduction protein with cAMP-binding, CBS, and nucleotidyltransferase domain